jgi:hypothetical protein
MRTLAGALVVTLLSLGGCEQAQQGFDDGFNNAFAKNAKASCVSTAAKSGASPDVIEPYCTCFVAEVTAWPMKEKMQFDPTSEKLAQVVEKCRPK